MAHRAVFWPREITLVVWARICVWLCKVLHVRSLCVFPPRESAELGQPDTGQHTRAGYRTNMGMVRAIYVINQTISLHEETWVMSHEVDWPPRLNQS